MRCLRQLSIGLSGLLGLTTTSLGCGVVLLGEGDEASAELPSTVVEAFDRSCSSPSGCHSASDRAGGLALDDSALAGLSSQRSKAGPDLLVFGDIEASYLAHKMLAPDRLPKGISIEGAPMPPAATENSEADVAIILSWIMFGGAAGEESGGELEDEGAGDKSGQDSSDVTDQGSGGEFCEDKFDPTEVTFSKTIVGIFDRRCGTAGCHDRKGIAPLLAGESSHEAIVGVQAGGSVRLDYVEEGEPEESYLWHKVSGTHTSIKGGGGQLMPIGTELCANEIRALYTWILEGADD